MEWIKLILPLLGVLFGWGLAESGKVFSDKKQDKRKLKKLLFFLLEIRNHLFNELSIEKDLDDFLKKFSAKVKEKTGEEIEIAISELKPLLQPIILKSKNDDINVEFLEKSIDEVIKELAEVLPIFAFELNGQHRIKERLKNADSYLTEFEPYITQIPFDIRGWVRPKLTDELLLTLNENIIEIAGKIDRATKKSIKKMLKEKNQESNSKMDLFLDEYIAKALEHIN